MTIESPRPPRPLGAGTSRHWLQLVMIGLGAGALTELASLANSAGDPVAGALALLTFSTLAFSAFAAFGLARAAKAPRT